MKVPEPQKLPSGNYFIRLRLGGSSIPITTATAAECRRQAQLIKAEYLSGKRQASSDHSSTTLGQLIDQYIAKYELALSPATIRGYVGVRRNRFQSYMDTPISKIDLQKMINEELLIPKSRKTVKNAWGLVSAALRDAGASLPAVKVGKVPIKEIPFLQADEIMPFCKAMEGDVAEIAALLELHGLRASEVKGLTWSDIDLSRGFIRVHSAVVPNKENKYVAKDTTKNATSTRTVPIMIPRLKEILAAVEDKTGCVVSLHPTNCLRRINQGCEAAGITVVGNHGLRHSFASLCYHLGIDDRQIMEWGGWADTTTMHKIYIRLAEKDKKAAASKMSGFFSKTDEAST